MSPYMIYQIVQAEQAEQRARYGAAQRQADARRGELAATMARSFRRLGFRRLARPAAALRGVLLRRPARETP